MPAPLDEHYTRLISGRKDQDTATDARTDALDEEASGTLPLLMSTGRAAAELGITPKSVRTEIHAGRLRAVRYGRKILVPGDELERFAAGLPAVIPGEAE